MAQKGGQLDQTSISCSICLELLRDPVTTTCGHSFCKNCIQSYWDTQDDESMYSCPQCRYLFIPRPLLQKNIMLAALVEELKVTHLQREDVLCDVCTGKKLKAIKSCLVCLVSYCEKHLQTHYDVAPLKKHSLVEPSKKLQENICSRHNEVMKIFCRTDQQCICFLCSMEEHKDHEKVTAAAEKSERQKDLKVRRVIIQQRIQDRKTHLTVLQQEMDIIKSSADKAVEDSEKVFTEMICVMEKRRQDVKQQLRSQQETEVGRVKMLQEKLEKEIAGLNMNITEVEKLLRTEDHNQFLQNYHSLSALSGSSNSPNFSNRPLRYFEEVTAAVSKVRDKLQNLLREEWTNISRTEVDTLLSEPEPKTRAGFLKHSREIKLDPNSAYRRLMLSEGNRKVTVTSQNQSPSSHPDRFTDFVQVLSRESLTGRCYWEVEVKGGRVWIAVAYKDISRAGKSDECGFGRNDKSWLLDRDTNSCEFSYNGNRTPVSGSLSSRVGVFLNHSAGILSFYNVSGTMTLLHRVQTKFTGPLYAGIGLYPGASAELCKIR